MPRYINNRFMDKMDLQTIQKYTKVSIERAKLKKHITDTFYAVVKKFDGKQINKRLQTALQKELGEGFVISSEMTGGSHMNLFVWQSKADALITFNNRLMIFVGYNSVYNSHGWSLAEFNYEKYMEQSGNRTRKQIADDIERYSNALADAPTLVADYNEALARLETAREALGALATTDWE